MLSAPSPLADLRLDVAFPIRGGAVVPVDHGYALYSALCHRVAALHTAPWLAIHPLRGRPEGGALVLDDDAALHLRAPPAELTQILPLAQQRLQVNGRALQLGEARLQLVLPSPQLGARMVVIKGFLEEGPFQGAVERQLENLGVRAQVRVGARRVAQIAEHKVVGFALQLSRLSEDASLLLQYRGLGGRQRMGCGVLVPS